MAEIRLFFIERYRQSTLKLLLLLFTVGFSPVARGSLVILWYSIKTLLKLGATHGLHVTAGAGEISVPPYSTHCQCLKAKQGNLSAFNYAASPLLTVAMA